MQNQIAIEGQDGSLRVRVTDYEHRSARDVSDANWVAAVATIAVGPFRGAVELSLTTQDLNRFMVDLERATSALAGTVTLEPYEGVIRLSLSFQRSGSVQVEGHIESRQQSTATLTFLFTSDQTYLKTTVEQLQRVCAHFPIMPAVS